MFPWALWKPRIVLTAFRPSSDIEHQATCYWTTVTMEQWQDTHCFSMELVLHRFSHRTGWRLVFRKNPVWISAAFRLSWVSSCFYSGCPVERLNGILFTYEFLIFNLNHKYTEHALLNIYILSTWVTRKTVWNGKYSDRVTSRCYCAAHTTVWDKIIWPWKSYGTTQPLPFASLHIHHYPSAGIAQSVM